MRSAADGDVIEAVAVDVVVGLGDDVGAGAVPQVTGGQRGAACRGGAGGARQRLGVISRDLTG